MNGKEVSNVSHDRRLHLSSPLTAGRAGISLLKGVF